MFTKLLPFVNMCYTFLNVTITKSYPMVLKFVQKEGLTTKNDTLYTMNRIMHGLEAGSSILRQFHESILSMLTQTQSTTNKH